MAPRNSPAAISVPRFSPFNSPRIPSPRLPRSTDSRPNTHPGPSASRTRLRPIVLIPLVCLAFVLWPYLAIPAAREAGAAAAAAPQERAFAAPYDNALTPEVAFEPSFQSAKQQFGKASTQLMKAIGHHLHGAAGTVGGVRGSEVYTEDRGYVHYPAPGKVTGEGTVRHPISWLVEEAGRKWEGMLARQSTTLEESVKEYRRRYGRAPPKGYEMW